MIQISPFMIALFSATIIYDCYYSLPVTFNRSNHLDYRNSVFGSCIETIVLQYFLGQGSNVTLLLHNDKSELDGIADEWLDFVDAVSRHIAVDSKISTIISTEPTLNTFNRLRNIIPSGCVLFIRDETDSNVFFNKVNTTHQSWYPRSKYIVLAETYTEEFMKETIRLLWKVNVYNFVILVKSDQVGGCEFCIDLYTWFPFDASNNCGEDVNEIVLIDRYNETGFGKNENLFPQKVPYDFKQCPVKLSTFHWPPASMIDPKKHVPEDRILDGHNIRIMRTLLETRNLTLRYIPPPEGTRWGVMLPNGSWTGMFGELSAGRADIGAAGGLQTLERFMMFDLTSTYMSTYIQFYVPLPQKLPHWRNMLSIFSPWFWVTIITLYVTISVIICWMSRLSAAEERITFRKFSDCFLVMWSISVGTSSHHFPRTMAIRIAFLIWVIYNLHINLVYSSSLLGFITSPTYEEPIESTNQLLSANIPVLTVYQFMPIAKVISDRDIQEVAKRFHRYVNHSKDIEMLIRYRNISILDTQEHFEDIAKESVTEVHALSQAVIRFNTAIYTRKGSVFYEAVHKVQNAVYENGLLSNWVKNFSAATKYKCHLSKTRTDKHLIPLTLQELQGSFYLLLFGLAISTVAFIVELITRYCVKNNTSTV